MTRSILDYALGYAARGLRVLPLKPRGKQPASEHAVKDATVHAPTIREWWRRQPEANIAIAVPDEWRVLDIDPRNGGDSAIDALIDKHGALPETIRARTGGAGEHYLFRFPSGAFRSKPATGIDLLGPGKYFVVWPSIVPLDKNGNAQPNGGRYVWTSKPRTEIAAAPAWLVDLARVREEPAPRPRVTPHSSPDVLERARKYVVQCAQRSPAISGQGGHNQTFHVAQKLVRGFSLDEETAFRLLEQEYNPLCQPPWSTAQLRRKVREAAKRGHMRPGDLLDRERR